jgi:hypothetical protein
VRLGEGRVRIVSYLGISVMFDCFDLASAVGRVSRYRIHVERMVVPSFTDTCKKSSPAAPASMPFPLFPDIALITQHYLRTNSLSLSRAYD